jgi:hypothetical protein
MHQEQYIIKDAYRSAVTPTAAIKNLTKAKLNEEIFIDEDGEPHSNCLIDFFNPMHISALLCNYSALKEDC